MENLPEEINQEEVKPQEYGLSEEKALELKSNLPQILSERSVFVPQYDEIIKSDIDSPETAKKARSLRLLIKDNRTKGIMSWHKLSKEFFLRGGQFIDAIKNKEIAVNERMEEALEKIEKHAEIAEANKKKELSNSRFEQLKVYLLDPQEKILDLAGMDEEMFSEYLAIKKNQYDKHQANLLEKQEEEARQQIIRDLEIDRKDTLLNVWSFMSNEQKEVKLGEMSQDNFDALYAEVLGKKESHDAEQTRIKEENEKLAKEKEEEDRKRQLEIENRKKVHAERSQKLTGLWGNMPEKWVDVIYVDLSDDDFELMLSDAKKANNEAALLKRKNDIFNERKLEVAAYGDLYNSETLPGFIPLTLDTIKEDYDKLISALISKKAEIDAKQAELNRLAEEREKEKARKIAEEKKIEQEKRKLAKKGVNAQILAWIGEFKMPETKIEDPIVDDIKEKFIKFIGWSKEQINE